MTDMLTTATLTSAVRDGSILFNIVVLSVHEAATQVLARVATSSRLQR